VRVLLDTNVILRLALEPERLDGDVLALLTDDATSIVISTVSPWEIAIKWGLGKLSIPGHPRAFASLAVRELGASLLPIVLDHVLGVADLPDHHGDPFDRLLIAQARAEKMSIVTADRVFSAYDVDVISAR
jgi:PIN domain nuclease of toxin-antitoxin system